MQDATKNTPCWPESAVTVIGPIFFWMLTKGESAVTVIILIQKFIWLWCIHSLIQDVLKGIKAP